MARDYIPLKVCLAAALLQLTDANGERLIPHEDAKRMSADQIISLFVRDHDPVRHEHGGPDEPWNLTYRFIRPHRKKSGQERTEMARERDVRRTVDEHVQRMLLKQPGRKPPRKSRWASRPMRSAKMRTKR